MPRFAPFCLAFLLIAPGVLAVTNSTSPAATPPAPRISFVIGSFDPLRDPLPISDDMTSPQTAYCIVQFTGPVIDDWKTAVTATGAALFGYVPEYAFIARMSDTQRALVSGMPFVRWIGAYHPGYKLAPSLALENGNVMMSVLYIENPDAVEKAVSDMGIQLLWRDSLALRVIADVSMARPLAFIPEVLYVEPLHNPEPCNNNSARIMTARQTNDGNYTGDGSSLWSYNASLFDGITGNGVIVAVADTGVDGNHIDFSGKKVWFKDYLGVGDWSDSMGHGTHVAGTVLGSGAGQAGKYAGVAPGATLIGMSAIGSTISQAAVNAQTLKDARDHGGEIITNSWGDPSLHGTYGSMAIAYDKGVRDCDVGTSGNQSMIVVFAAGNEGFTGIREPATAKNVITIGATGNNNGLDPGQIAGFSSNGPTSDGRRKPDVMAPGAQVTSCLYQTSNGYVTHDGTSMAAPGAAGAIAVVVQYWKDNYGVAPSAAMVKALLANGGTAMDTQYTYPGNGQGWGRINLARSLLGNFTYQVLSEDQKVPLRTTETMLYTANVITGDYPLKVTMAYTDAPGTSGVSPNLVNNLDLEVTGPTGSVYYGNVFSNGASATGGARDNVNNLEGILVKNPMPGTWTIKVIGTNVPQDAQDYSIAFSGDIDVSLDFIDLKVLSGPQIAPAEIVEGNTITFNATIRNNGTLPAAGVLARFKLGSSIIANITIPDFSSNSTRDVSCRWTAIRGKFTLRIELDPLNVVREKNETNNVKEKMIEALYYGLVVVPSASELEVEPAAPANFNLNIKNSGNANDSYVITQIGALPPPGWMDRLSLTNVSVKKGSQEMANYTAWPPANSTVGERFNTTIRVVSQGNSSYNQLVNLSVRVKQVFGMSFTTNATAETRLDAGAHIETPFVLSNTGNGKDYYTLASNLIGRPTSWKSDLGGKNITLGARQTLNITLKLDVPPDAFANDSLTLNVTCRSSQGNLSWYRLKYIVVQKFITELAVDGPTDRVEPGGALTYKVNVRNGGNGNDTVFFKTAAPDGWNVTLTRPAMILLPRTDGNLEMQISVPAGSLAGVYTVNFTSLGSGGNVVSRLLNVTVTQQYRVSISVSPPNRTITQGETAAFVMMIRNAGNGNDTFDFVTLNLVSGWTINYSRPSVTLEPGKDAQIELTVRSQNTTPAGNYSFIVKAVSGGRPVIYNNSQVLMELLELPPPPPPPSPPPPPVNPIIGGNTDLMPYLWLLMAIVVISVAGGAGYAMAKRKQKKDAWKPSMSQIPEVPPPAPAPPPPPSPTVTYPYASETVTQSYYAEQETESSPGYAPATDNQDTQAQQYYEDASPAEPEPDSSPAAGVDDPPADSLPEAPAEPAPDILEVPATSSGEKAPQPQSGDLKDLMKRLESLTKK